MTVRLVVAGVLAAGALLTGCQTTVVGDAQRNADTATEPSSSTARPTRIPSPPSTTPAAPTPSSPPQVLAPQNGYVFIETKSGQTRCQLSATDVGCEAPFSSPPIVDGYPANGVRLTAAGQLTWIVGNLGDIPVVTIDYRTYAAEGWTVVATEAGTRFTNDATAHGMFVSIAKVDVF